MPPFHDATRIARARSAESVRCERACGPADVDLPPTGPGAGRGRAWGLAASPRPDHGDPEPLVHRGRQPYGRARRGRRSRPSQGHGRGSSGRGSRRGQRRARPDRRPRSWGAQAPRKTTFLNVEAGLNRPTSDPVALGRHRPRAAQRAARLSVGDQGEARGRRAFEPLLARQHRGVARLHLVAEAIAGSAAAGTRARL